MAGYQWLMRLQAMLEQQLLGLLARLFIDVEARDAIFSSERCAGRLRKRQAVIDFVFVVQGCPVAPATRDTAG